MLLAAVPLLAACQDNLALRDPLGRGPSYEERLEQERNPRASGTVQEERGAVAETPVPVSWLPDVAVSREPWTFDRAGGEAIATAHHRVYTTAPLSPTAELLPYVLETMLERYRALADLPAPGRPLESYLMATPEQWSAIARRLLGRAAEPYLALPSGGFAAGGRGFFHDLGAERTLRLAAHEGWHQYHQTVFAQPLPAWLDEAIGVSMEGLVFRDPPGGVGPRQPVPEPWANVERFDRLKSLAIRGRLMPLEELLTKSPADLLAGSDDPLADPPQLHSGGDAALGYYAQAWALERFLAEAAGDRAAAGLRELLRDAQAGRIAREVPIEEINARRGTTLFRHYISDDLAAADAAYKDFLRALLAPGNRERIAAGLPPRIAP